ncbi:MAG: WD40 repeat-like protein [Alyxoria varia]|nr:MAG: WD40 repeat-like protein [Alyxoria varia]
MSITEDAIWAALPSTTRGQPTPLSSDPKGERIAYASNKSIFLRSIDHPEISKQYAAHTAQTSVARFAPSGFFVASGDVEGNVKVWDCVGEGSTRGDYHIIAGRINDIAWDGDSQRIIAVGDGKERFGHCITADSGNSVGEISGQSSQINCVSIRQQRPLRAATGSDDTSLAFFHGAPFKYNTSMRGNHNKFVYGTVFSPDGASLVSVGSDRRIWLYDGKSGEPQKQIGDGVHTGSILGVSWAQDSKSFVTCSADQTVRIWDAEVGKETQSWKLGGDGGVSIPDQQVGVVWPHGRADGTIISADLEGNLNYFAEGKSDPVRVVRGHQRNITAATSSDIGGAKTLWTGGADGRVRAWDVASGEGFDTDGESHSNYIAGLATNSDGTRIYSVGWDDSLRTLDANAKTFTSAGTSKTSGQPRSVTHHAPSDKLLAAVPDGIDIIQNHRLITTCATNGYSPTAISASTPTGDIIALTGSDKSLRICTFNSSSNLVDDVKTIPDILTSPGSCLAFSPSISHLAVGTSSGSIAVFNTSDWSVATTRWSSHAARVTGIAWSEDGRFAASGSLDTNVHVWSLASPGKRVKVGNAHKDGVSGVVWVDGGADGKGRVASVGADAAIKLWKVEGLV